MVSENDDNITATTEIRAPVNATGRHPYFPTSAAAIGPVKQVKIIVQRNAQVSFI